MLYKAITSDRAQLDGIHLLQQKYKNEEQMQEQIFQWPVQLNSIDQLQQRLQATHQRYKDETILMTEIKEKKIEMIKTKLEDAWYSRFETIIKRQRQSIMLFLSIHHQLQIYYKHQNGANSRLLSEADDERINTRLNQSMTDIRQMNVNMPEKLQRMQEQVRQIKVRQR